jgi:hypothetical protein
MLASHQHAGSVGFFSEDVQARDTFVYEVIDFIGRQLPIWRDRPERPNEDNETRLTSSLCGHLNTACYRVAGFDILQFRNEEPDQQDRNRTLDLVVAPRGVTLVVGSRRYSDFDYFLPIECKRLPTPTGDRRDEREYVFNGNSSTGGIHRFKMGRHGAGCSVGVMIGYVQQESVAHWHETTSRWIRNLVAEQAPGWSDGDVLRLVGFDQVRRFGELESRHARTADQTVIALRHLWVEMN